MMKKTLAICLGLALILTLCGTFAGALASEVENGIDAIEDAMMKGNTNTSSFFDGMDDLREGTSADTHMKGTAVKMTMSVTRLSNANALIQQIAKEGQEQAKMIRNAFKAASTPSKGLIVGL